MFKGLELELIAELRSAFLGLLVGHQFDSDHQTQSAHVAYVAETLRPALQALKQILSHFRRVRHYTAFEQIKRGERGSNRYWIAAECRGMRSRRPVHNVGSRTRGGKPQAARN